MSYVKLIIDYMDAMSDAVWEHNYGEAGINQETQMFRRVNYIRRKLHKELRKAEKEAVKLLENEPSRPCFPEDCDDEYQTRLEWEYEYEPVCDEIYALRNVLGIKRMSVREWYHNYKRNKKNDKKNK